MQILLELSYLGGGFSGYQVQPGKRTVQSVMQDAIERIYGKRFDVRGCSRTDSGVHASSFYMTFFSEDDINIPPDRIPDALNSALPDDISVNFACIVPNEFHVRYDVLKKTYVYLIHDSRLRNPFLAGRVWELKRQIGPCEIERMRNAAKFICGRHDFSCFMASGASVEDTIRCVSSLTIERDGKLVKISITADGFLYNMVRIIVGTLIGVAFGKFESSDISRIILSRNRTMAGETAPACGLYLSNVKYNTNFGTDQRNEL